MTHERQKPRWQITQGKHRNYAKLRLELVKFLGGKCVYCGKNHNQRHLEFNHKTKRTWIACKIGRRERLKKYWEEARRGEIDLACRSCNAKLGKPGSEIYRSIWLEKNKTKPDVPGNAKEA